MKNTATLPLIDKLSVILATFFGVGYNPIMPGTSAAIFALGLFAIIKNDVLFFWVTIIIIIVSFLVCGRAERIFKKKDCKKIVIDDFVGMLVAMLFIPRELKFIIIAFFLFRMFDMLKIPPVNKLEKFDASLGIVGDDLVAGIYANLLLNLVRHFIIK